MQAASEERELLPGEGFEPDSWDWAPLSMVRARARGNIACSLHME